ncbi:MAG TPA: hypothetical protein VFV31_08685 [Chitinophagaceae bacterium]|nr:hypothetical protein [Chitinophagaceae bacterium]
MKFSLLIASLLVIVVMACNKDKFQTKPTISIKSVNTEVVPFNGSLVVTLECTDKEGDVQDSIFIVKRRLNKRVVPTVRDTLRYKFPVFPTNTRTEIQVVLDYQNILSAINPPNIPGSNPVRKELDTLVLKFAVRDKAGNKSDTVQSQQIFVTR